MFELRATRKIALVSSMAALYTVLNQMPGVPVIGAEGAKIGLISTVVPVFGLMLGPWLGASSALLGAVASRALTGASFFSWLALPAMPLSAFVAGALSIDRVTRFKGWMLSALVIGGLILAWYMTWIGRAVPLFPVLHWACFVLILIFRGRFALFLRQGRRVELILCVLLCSLSATMVAQMYGTLAFIAAAELTLIRASLFPSFFVLLMPVVIIERLTIALASTLLGVPMLSVLKSQFGRNRLTQEGAKINAAGRI